MFRGLRSRTGLRAAAATAALVVYTLPLMLGALADVSHTAYHVVGAIREYQQVAAALGLVHLHDQAHHRIAATSHATSPARFEHSHGGTAHSHNATTDALLLAVQHADEDSGPGQVPALKLSDHVPGTAEPVRIVYALAEAQALDAAPMRWHPGDEPPLPPPRA